MRCATCGLPTNNFNDYNTCSAGHHTKQNAWGCPEYYELPSMEELEVSFTHQLLPDLLVEAPPRKDKQKK